MEDLKKIAKYFGFVVHYYFTFVFQLPELYKLWPPNKNLDFVDNLPNQQSCKWNFQVQKNVGNILQSYIEPFPFQASLNQMPFL